MNTKTKIIALGSKAEVGKDYFADILIDLISQRGFTVEKRSLATPLKGICDPFLKEYFNISAFTTVKQEKDFIRPFLVTVGDLFRESSEGTYFTEKLTEYLNSRLDLDFLVVPDMRYIHYKNDEYWYFNKKGKYSYIIDIDRIKEDGTLVEPVNERERENAPIIRKLANSALTWESNKELAEAVVQKELEKVFAYFEVVI